MEVKVKYKLGRPLWGSFGNTPGQWLVKEGNKILARYYEWREAQNHADRLNSQPAADGEGT